MVGALPALGHLLRARGVARRRPSCRRRPDPGLKPLDALEHLRSLLAQREVPLAEADGAWEGSGQHALAAWDAFKAAATEPVAEPFERHGERLHVHYDDDDLLLFETGRTRRDSIFFLSFRRQFGFHTDELEYAGMNALELEINLTPEPELAALPAVALWGHPSALDEWVAKVEAHPAFTAAVARAAQARFRVWQTDI